MTCRTSRTFASCTLTRSTAAKACAASVRTLPAPPKGLSRGYILVNRHVLDRIDGGAAFRVFCAVNEVSGERWYAPVVSVRIYLLKSGVKPRKVDDVIAKALVKSRGAITWSDRAA